MRYDPGSFIKDFGEYLYILEGPQLPAEMRRAAFGDACCLLRQALKEGREGLEYFAVCLRPYKDKLGVDFTDFGLKLELVHVNHT